MTTHRRGLGIVPEPPVRQASLRERNLATVSRTIFRSAEPVSRAQLSKITGLTRSTVSRLVEELLGSGLVAEVAGPEDRRPGRPAVPLAPAAGTLVGLGLHVNVDYMAVKAVDLTGAVVAEAHVEGDYESSDPARVLGEAAQMARAAIARLDGARVTGVCAALPGLVDRRTQRLLLAPNLGWHDLRPADFLADALPAGVPIEVHNDADLAAVAVARSAPGRPASPATFAYLTGDIGIGAAIVYEGQLLPGEHGWAGEIGHVAVEPDGPRCLCGASGCLERYAGKHAVREAAGLPPSATGEELAAAAAAGYGPARMAVERAGWALGVVLADLINIIDVGEVVLGEGFVPIVELMRGAIEEQLRVRTLSRPWAEPVVRAAPAERALAARGGATLVLERAIDEPADLCGGGTDAGLLTGV